MIIDCNFSNRNDNKLLFPACQIWICPASLFNIMWKLNVIGFWNVGWTKRTIWRHNLSSGNWLWIYLTIFWHFIDCLIHSLTSPHTDICFIGYSNYSVFHGICITIQCLHVHYMLLLYLDISIWCYFMYQIHYFRSKYCILYLFLVNR